MSKNNPIRQHWVPKMYIRSFATEVSTFNTVQQTYVLNLKSGKEFISSIDNIFVKKNFYTFGKHETQPNYIIEETLSKIESEATPILKAMIQGNIIHENQSIRKVISYFLATMLLRTPQFQHIFDQHLKGFTLEPLGNFPQNLFNQIDKEEIQIISSWYSNLDNEGKNVIYLKVLIESIKEIASTLMEKNWELFKAQDSYFITSDNPVVVYHSSEQNYGISTLGVSIHIALSPQVILWLSDEKNNNSKAIHNLPKDVVSGLNHLTASKANDFVISCQPFDKIKNDLLNV